MLKTKFLLNRFSKTNTKFLVRITNKLTTLSIKDLLLTDLYPTQENIFALELEDFKILFFNCVNAIQQNFVFHECQSEISMYSSITKILEKQIF